MTKETRVKRWFALLSLTSAAALGLSAPEIRSVGSFQVVVFDLTKGDYAPRVVLEERLVSVRELLGPEPPAAAITGTFFAWENGRPVGEVVIDGDVVADGARGSAIGVDWYGRVHIFDTEVRGWQDWFPYRYGLRAGVRIVREGVVDPKPWTQGFRDRSIWGSAARTAVGTTPGGKLVMMATRSSVTLSTLGRQMTALGVTNAVALDGGGSTMLYANDRYLISTSRRLNNLFIVEEKSPLDDKFRAHLQRLARNQTDGVANGVSGTGAANPYTGWYPRVRLPRPHLAIIIPAYNEQERLGPTLARIAEYARTLDFDAEIWVVNDGSADDTAKLVRCVAESEPLVHLLDCEQNQGKGAAVRRGMLEIDAEWLLMSDADLATPIEELDKLWPHVGEATPIAIGSRPLKESELEVRQPWYREMMGRCFNLAVRTLGIKGIADTQCGFKLYRQDVARDIFSRSKIDGFGFDFEVLMIARDLGYNIAEVPIRWQHKEGSKVNLLRDGVRMLRELMLLRLAGRARRISPRTRGQ